MEILAKVNGTDVPVEVDNTIIDNIKSDAVDSFIRSIIATKANYIAERSGEDDFTEEEFESLVTAVVNKSAQVYDFLADEILTGKFANTVEIEYQRILDNRVRYYTVEGTIEIPVSFIVKANNIADANAYIENMDGRELEDYIEWYDASLENAEVVDDGNHNYDNEFGEAFDAT